MRNKDRFLREFLSEKEDVFGLIRELTGYVSYYKRTLERLERDTLTGLFGNNKFIEFTHDLENRAESVGVAFFDVNGLKACNDTKGHQAGDALIQKAAESIMITFGKKANAFRTGGDEFVVIIIDCTEVQVNALMYEWREELARLNSKDDGIYCSVSAGSAFGSEDYRLSDILKLADERMYEEKSQSAKSEIQ